MTELWFTICIMFWYSPYLCFRFCNWEI